MKRALWLVAAAAACVVTGGIVIAASSHQPIDRGLYCSLATSTTDGCDITLHGMARLVTALLMVFAIPLLGAAGGSLLSAHLRRNLRGEFAAELKDARSHLSAIIETTERRLHAAAEKHAGQLLDRLDVHVEGIKAHVSTATAAAAAAQPNGQQPPEPAAAPPLDRKLRAPRGSKAASS